MNELVQVGEFPAELQPAIDAEFRCHPPEAALADKALAARIEGIITRSNYTIPDALVSALPGLKIIATSGVGFDGINVGFASRKGVVVTNTPGVLDAAVCELGIGILLALLRQIPAADRFVREGHWNSGPFPLTTSLSGKPVGIVGLGRIGQGIAARLVPFGAHLLYTGSRKPGLPYRHVESLRELATAVEILFVCCQGGPKTEKLINAEVLSALGARGFLINMARGTVVDEAALIEALTVGTIQGAGLDVYSHEPRINAAFLDLPNTVLTPHVGSATRETREVMLRLTLDNLHAVIGGKMPLTPVIV